MSTPTARVPNPIATAADRLFTHAFKAVLPLEKLRALVQAHPVAVWDEFATFHVRETIQWGDGSADSVSFVATLKGCEVAWHRAAAVLVALRGEQQGFVSKTRVQHRFALLLVVKNKVNSLSAWLDCETGRLETGKDWPGQTENTALGKRPSLESGVAA